MSEDDYMHWAWQLGMIEEAESKLKQTEINCPNCGQLLSVPKKIFLDETEYLITCPKCNFQWKTKEEKD